MHRFFIEETVNGDQVIIYDKNDVNHIKRALRVQLGEKLEICDGSQKEYVVEVIALEDQVTCHVLEKSLKSRESHVRVDLYQGLAKGSKMESIIQKSVELGVHDIYPLKTKRVIVKLDAKGEKKKQERWQKIADEAAKQSKRTYITQLKASVQVKTLTERLDDYDLVLVAYELEKGRTLHDYLSGSFKRVAVVIGPEGGFEEEEVEILVQAGAKSISLGPRILRTETAGPTLLGIIQYAIGDIK